MRGLQRRLEFPLGAKRSILWRRKWQPTPEILPGKSHGQRSLVSYSPEGCKRVRHNLVTKQTASIAATPWTWNAFVTLSVDSVPTSSVQVLLFLTSAACIDHCTHGGHRCPCVYMCTAVHVCRQQEKRSHCAVS